MASCKFQKLQQYVSYDSGHSWTALQVYMKGALIESGSTDCPDCPIMYDWRVVEGDYMCVDTDKYQKLQKYESFDCGYIYTPTIPSEFEVGELIESASTDCGYVYREKVNMVFSDGSTLSVPCNDNPELTNGDTKNPSGSHTVSALTSAVIGECVTSIGQWAFSSCSVLTSVTIPNSVENIEIQAFSGATSLSSLTIPNSVISIEDKAFDGTPWWESYSADTANRYDNLIYINNVAYKAVSTNVTSVTFKPNTVGIGGGAFSGCTSLTSITIPNTVTNIQSSAFSECRSLKSVVIPNNVTAIDNLTFHECTSLTSITIPNGVTSIGQSAFFNCNKLTSITIPNGVTFLGVAAFSRCSKLNGITILATVPPEMENMTVLDYTNNCPIYVPSESLEVYKTARNWHEYSDRIQPIA